MLLSGKLLAVGILSVAASLAVVPSRAETTDGSDYHPLNMNSPVNPDVRAGAMQAARPGSTETPGETIVAPPMKSSMTRDEVRKGAIRAAHSSSTEAPGETTAMPMMRNESRGANDNRNSQDSGSNRNGQGG